MYFDISIQNDDSFTLVIWLMSSNMTKSQRNIQYSHYLKRRRFEMCVQPLFLQSHLLRLGHDNNSTGSSSQNTDGPILAKYCGLRYLHGRLKSIKRWARGTLFFASCGGASDTRGCTNAAAERKRSRGVKMHPDGIMRGALARVAAYKTVVAHKEGRAGSKELLKVI